MQILQSWARPGLQELHILAGTIQHFQNAISDAWVPSLPKTFAREKVLMVALFGDIVASRPLLVSFHVRERDKELLRSILSGSVWTGC